MTVWERSSLDRLRELQRAGTGSLPRKRPPVSMAPGRLGRWGVVVRRLGRCHVHRVVAVLDRGGGGVETVRTTVEHVVAERALEHAHPVDWDNADSRGDWPDEG